MNASQAIAKWQSEDTIDAFQPWEIVEMLDALAGRVIELEAAQQSAQADLSLPFCPHISQRIDGSCPYCALPKPPNH